MLTFDKVKKTQDVYNIMISLLTCFKINFYNMVYMQVLVVI